MIVETQESLKKYREKLKMDGYSADESISITSSKCSCGSGCSIDRYIEKEIMGCPACDPQLGSSSEGRLHNYKMLITTPFKEK